MGKILLGLVIAISFLFGWFVVYPILFPSVAALPDTVVIVTNGDRKPHQTIIPDQGEVRIRMQDNVLVLSTDRHSSWVQTDGPDQSKMQWRVDAHVDWRVPMGANDVLLQALKGVTTKEHYERLIRDAFRDAVREELKLSTTKELYANGDDRVWAGVTARMHKALDRRAYIYGLRKFTMAQTAASAERQSLSREEIETLIGPLPKDQQAPKVEPRKVTRPKTKQIKVEPRRPRRVVRRPAQQEELFPWFSQGPFPLFDGYPAPR